MPSQVERVSLAEFTITTGADEASILDTAARGLAAAKPAMGSAPKETAAGDGKRVYSVKGPGGFIELMRFVLSWERVGGDTYQVKLRAGEFATNQAKLLIFIPIGPKEVPALKHLERFSTFVRTELEAQKATA